MRSRTIAVTVALLGVVGCGSEAEQPADPPRAPEAATPSPVPSPVPSRSPTTSRAEVDAVVTEFLDSLGSESRRAWELLTPRAQASWGSYDGFADLQTEYAEGLASFAGTDRTHLELPDGVTVVVLEGEVTREGMTEHDAAPLPVRIVDGAALVELSNPALGLPGYVDIEVPAVGSPPLEPGTTLQAFAPEGSQVTMTLDGERVEVEQQPADGDRTRITATPELTPGRHVLVVVAERTDRLVVAAASVFDVEG